MKYDNEKKMMIYYDDNCRPDGPPPPQAAFKRGLMLEKKARTETKVVD